jgi:glycosyltransferase involved in cell wall biosynthesis
MKFSFILLAHNEELTIKEEIENLYNKIIKNFSDEYEVIICED